MPNNDQESLASVLRAFADMLSKASAFRGGSNQLGATLPRKREVEQTVFEASSDTWMTSDDLARRSGYPQSSYLRGAIAALIRDGLLQRCGHKIRRTPVPDKPCPS